MGKTYIQIINDAIKEKNIIRLKDILITLRRSLDTHIMFRNSLDIEADNPMRFGVDWSNKAKQKLIEKEKEIQK